MSQPQTIQHEKHPDTHHDIYSKTVFGFWIYLISDFVLFGTIFATYAVLRHSTFGGPSAKEVFDLGSVLERSLMLICCSFTVGIASAAAHRRDKKISLLFFGITFLLGLWFMISQWGEFEMLLKGGNHWKNNAFLSAYFTLLGTFAAHVVLGLLWIFVLGIPTWLHELTGVEIRRLTCLKMFWQFLNVVWIFIYTFVYLLGG